MTRAGRLPAPAPVDGDVTPQRRGGSRFRERRYIGLEARAGGVIVEKALEVLAHRAVSNRLEASLAGGAT
ncbi:hypothetical protein ACMHYB_21515 [Sorangium sp. So ce1128]